MLLFKKSTINNIAILLIISTLSIVCSTLTYHGNYVFGLLPTFLLSTLSFYLIITKRKATNITINAIDTINTLIKIFFIYISFYGVISIYIDNIIVRSIKDFIMVILSLYGLYILKKNNQLNGIWLLSLFTIVTISFIGAIGILEGNIDLITYIYGIKITVVPMGFIFLGYVLAIYKVRFEYLILFLYLAIVIAWIIQSYLGINKLMDMGFVYGINVKNFVDGSPRLPSLVGTPSGYAFFLALTSTILTTSKFFKNRTLLLVIFHLNTALFLYLSTMRSAFVFWLICQLFIITIPVINNLTKIKHATIFVGFGTPFLLYIYNSFLASNSITSTSSFISRITHWGDYLPPLFTSEWWIGNGWGYVGAASKRLALLGSTESSNYAVDNQNFALVEQIGIVGYILFAIMYFSIYAIILKEVRKSKPSPISITALALMTGTLASSLFTNILESIPLILFVWLFVGMALHEVSNKKSNNNHKIT